MSKKKRYELRTEMKRVLSNMDERWLSAASSQTCENLKILAEKELHDNFSVILGYIPHFSGEVDIHPFLNWAAGNKKLYFPNFESSKIEFFLAPPNWEDYVELNDYGVPGISTREQPFSSAIAEESLVLIPGLAFDSEGNRLSADFGYYDKFLRRSGMHAATKVGVCWSLQFVKEVPADTSHMMMDWICHERGYVKTKLDFEEL